MQARQILEHEFAELLLKGTDRRPDEVMIIVLISKLMSLQITYFLTFFLKVCRNSSHVTTSHSIQRDRLV